MDCKTFIVEILSTITWPVVVLIIAYLFYEPIKILIKSLSQVTIGNTSLSFSKEVVANKIANKQEADKSDTKEPVMSKNDILNIPDDDYEFMQEIANNKDFMPTSENELFKYNSLVSHGYFEKVQKGEYKPGKKGAEIISVLKSIYYS